MNQTRHKLAAILTLTLLVAVIAVPMGLTWQQVRKERLNQALIAAVKANDDRAVARLLNMGADANCQDEPPRKFSLWETLMQVVRGSRPRPSDADTPLLVALAVTKHITKPNLSRYPSENVPLIRSLLDHGARIDGPLGGTESTPLIWAVMSGKHATIHLLLERGANVNAQESDHSTALIDAVWRSDEETVSALLSHHADVSVRHDQLGTALEMAQDANHEFPNPTTKRIIHALKAAGAKK